MSRRVIGIVAVALALGIGAGAVAEHTRLKHASDEPGTSQTTIAATVWFGNRTAAACPALNRWMSSAVAAYVAVVQKAGYTSIRRELQPQISAAQNAFRAMVPLATPAGKNEVRFLLVFHGRLQSAAKNASSVGDLFRQVTALGSARSARDIGLLVQGVTLCAKR